MATTLPTNRAPFSVDEVAVATAGVIARRGGDATHVGVNTDTRTTAPGNVFVALRGERFDGHDYLAAAVARGASLLVVDERGDVPDGAAVVRVADTTRALGALARAHRRRWASRTFGARRTVVAVGGSAGKTTTRRAIAALLTNLGAGVHYSAGNLNNAIGIPLVLLGLEHHHDTAVIEIGTSRLGEVAYGASLAEPDVAVLTLVAVEHSEGLGSIDDIAREEGALIEALGTAGVAVVNGDDPRCVAQLLRSRASRWLHYGKREGADVRIALRTPRGVRGGRLVIALRNFGLRGVRYYHEGEAQLAVDTPLLGEAGAYATAAAIAVATSVFAGELTEERVSEALAPLAAARDEGRLVPYERRDGVIVIDDSYNANAASTLVGITTAREIATSLERRLILVLGEMRELGPLSASEHDEVGAAAADAGAAEVVAVGGDADRVARAVQDAGGSVVFVDDADAAFAALGSRLRRGDIVLVKGSRGVGLDALVRRLLAADDARP